MKKILWLLAAIAVVVLGYWQIERVQETDRQDIGNQMVMFVREAEKAVERASRSGAGTGEELPHLQIAFAQLQDAKRMMVELDHETKRKPMVTELLDLYCQLLASLERRQKDGEDVAVQLSQVRHDLDVIASSLSPLGIAYWDQATLGPEWKKIVDRLTCEEVLNVYQVEVPPESYSWTVVPDARRHTPA